MKEIQGILPALLTPFDTDETVNEKVLRDLVEFFVSAGVDGLFVNGGTGEGIKQTEEERRLVAETVIDQIKGRVVVIIHVGAITTSTAIQLAKHAEDIGADAVASIPPLFSGTDADTIEQHYRLVAEASSLPLFLYYIPNLTGIDITGQMLERLMEIPTIKGVKFSSYDLNAMREYIEIKKGRLTVLYGHEEMLLPALVMGASGGIGGAYNIMPKLFVDIYHSFKKGEMKKAQNLQYKADRVIRVLDQFTYDAVLKEAMRLIGFDCGFCKRPTRPLSTEERKELQAGLSKLAFPDEFGGYWSLRQA